MQVNPLSLSPKEYSILGRLCASQKPDVARELLSIYDNKPLDKDHPNIQVYFIEFCRLQDIDPEEYKGALFKASKVEQRRLFIACMVHIYLPHLYVSATTAAGIRLDYGFISSLAESLNQKKSNISKMVREIVVTEKVYDEFRDRATWLVEQLTNGMKAHSETDNTDSIHQ